MCLCLHYSLDRCPSFFLLNSVFHKALRHGYTPDEFLANVLRWWSSSFLQYLFIFHMRCCNDPFPIFPLAISLKQYFFKSRSCPWFSCSEARWATTGEESLGITVRQKALRFRGQACFFNNIGTKECSIRIPSEANHRSHLITTMSCTF